MESKIKSLLRTERKFLARGQKGQTLIEILVSVAIFTTIIAGPVGFFIMSIGGQKRALISMEIVDNSSYALEYMSRALRMAKKDDLGGIDCLSGNKVNYENTYSDKGIKFRNYEDKCQEFFWDINDNRLKESKEGTPLPLTADDLEITSLKFQLSGETQEDNFQPRITIFFEIQKKGQPETKTKFQTTISQRNLDVTY
jgi:type II secretory pathway component PulJ